MTPRTKKKTIIALIYLVLFSFLGWAGWILFGPPQPTCFDGIQNQGELGVDCGGPCQPCSFQQVKDLEILQAQSLATQPGFIDLWAEVSNPNQLFGVPDFQYQFALYDAQGNLIKRIPGRSYLMPQSRRFIIYQKAPVEKTPVQVKLEFANPKWQGIQSYKTPLLFVRRLEFGVFGQTSTLDGLVVNRSDFDFDRVDLDIVLKNSTGRILGVASHEIRTLRSGEERIFRVIWPYHISGVTEKEIQVNTNVFLNDNYLKKHGTMEPFQVY